MPYLEGERTPNLPEATGSLHGLTLATSTPGHLARAAFEGLCCSLAFALDTVVGTTGDVDRVLVTGGGAASPGLVRTLATVLQRTLHVPPPQEYVARGAARQAAWVLSGNPDPPAWRDAGVSRVEPGGVVAGLRERYAALAGLPC